MVQTSISRENTLKLGEPFWVYQIGVSVGATLISAGTVETLALSSRFNVKANTRALDGYIDVTTAATADAAETITTDLSTNEGTPKVVVDDLDIKTAARTRFATDTNKKIAVDGTFQLVTTVSGAGGVATAATLDVLMLLVNESGVESAAD